MVSGNLLRPHTQFRRVPARFNHWIVTLATLFEVGRSILLLFWASLTF